MAINDLLKTIPVIHSASLVGYNSNKIKKKKKKLGDIVSLATANTIGSSLIKAEGDFLWQ